MTARPWMPLYIPDYLADTGHLSTIEHGAYLLLIMHYWQNRGLPSDESRLARICRMTPDEWADARETLAGFFDDQWRHKRIDDELSTAERRYEVRKNASDMGHKKRWGVVRDETPTVCQSDANGMPMACQSDVKNMPMACQPQPQPHLQEEVSISSLRSDICTPKRADRGSRLTEDWSLPSDWWQAAADIGLTATQIDEQAARFRDYWRAVPGAKGRKSDWLATWRNWCRTARDRQGYGSGHHTGGGQGGRPHSAALAAAHSLITGK